LRRQTLSCPSALARPYRPLAKNRRCQPRKARLPPSSKRWPVKTLADRSGRRLRLGHVQATTVEALRRLKRHQGGQSSRGGKAERTVYRVTARLVAAKVEDDSDIHLVIADPRTGGTLISELPALGCTRARPIRRAC
jgi:hypothetical protein